MSVAILSTSPLSAELIAYAAECGVELDAHSFITISNVMAKETGDEIIRLSLIPATVVFTSAHAVRATVAFMRHLQPTWSIYCIGNATRKEVEIYFAAEMIKATAADAATLAAQMVADKVPEAVFLCGDKRMGILPAILQAHNISLQEIVVYEMLEQPVRVSKKYDGVLFYSPSAVRSFFSVNVIAPGCILFAIGGTTASAVRELSGNEVIVTINPSKEQVVHDAIQFFNKKALASKI